MNTKEYVEGMPLREYIVKSLVLKSYRELVKDKVFTQKSGIKILGTLTYHTKKHNISLEEVFEYGLKNNIINPSMSYYDWLIFTGRSSVISKLKSDERKQKNMVESKKELLCKIGLANNLMLNKDEDEEVLLACLYDFFDKEQIDSILHENGF